jgi:hypothetical protein
MSTTDVGDAQGTPGADEGDRSPKNIAASAAHTLKQEAASFASDARDKAVSALEQQKQTATQTLDDFANAIRQAGDELAARDQSIATQVVRQAGDGLESFARSISEKRPEELLDAVRSFGRHNPTAFLAGSVLLGVALGRFLKSSGAEESGTMTSNMEGASLSGGGPGEARARGENGLADPTAAGATAIGATEDEIAGAAGGGPPTIEDVAVLGAATRGVGIQPDESAAGPTSSYESDPGDADRDRFGSRS